MTKLWAGKEGSRVQDETEQILTKREGRKEEKETTSSLPELMKNI